MGHGWGLGVGPAGVMMDPVLWVGWRGSVLDYCLPGCDLSVWADDGAIFEGGVAWGRRGAGVSGGGARGLRVVFHPNSV